MSIIREEYQNAKRILYPLLNKWHFSSVSWYWYEKKRSWVGYCNWFRKEIGFKYAFLDQDEGYNEQQFRLCIRHEIAHLASQHSGHHSKFLRILKQLEGHRYFGQMAYEGKKPKSKI